MPLDDRLRDALRVAADDVRPDVERQLDHVRSRSRRPDVPARGLVATFAAIAMAVVLLRTMSLDPLAMVASVVTPGGQTTVADSPAPADASEPLLGTYVLHVADGGTGDGAALLAGDWKMTLGDDASLVLTPPDSFEASSSLPLDGYVYALRGDRLFTNLFARHFPQGCTGPGTYRWQLVDSRLTVETMNDMCLHRITLLTSGSWTRVGE